MRLYPYKTRKSFEFLIIVMIIPFYIPNIIQVYALSNLISQGLYTHMCPWTMLQSFHKYIKIDTRLSLLPTDDRPTGLIIIYHLHCLTPRRSGVIGSLPTTWLNCDIILLVVFRPCTWFSPQNILRLLIFWIGSKLDTFKSH